MTFSSLGREHSLGQPHPLGKLPSISSAQPARHTEGFFRTNTHMSGQMTTHLNRIVSGNSLLQRGPAQRQCIRIMSKAPLWQPVEASDRINVIAPSMAVCIVFSVLIAPTYAENNTMLVERMCGFSPEERVVGISKNNSILSVSSKEGKSDCCMVTACTNGSVFGI